jgi:predicted peptidase
MTVSQQILGIIAKQVLDKHKVSKDKIFHVGLSGGGMLTKTYTERAT